MLQDTTAFTYYRNNPKAIGEPYKAIARNGVARKQTKSMCGILMHSSLAVTTQGVPLGLAAIRFWSRRRYKGCNALKRKVNPTRVPIQSKESIRWLENLRQATRLFADPERCVHVGDRESDIYELFCTACELKTHFLVRTCIDRLAGDGRHTITNEMDEVRVKGLHHVEVVDSKGKPAWTTAELRYRRVHVLPPIGKQKNYPALTMTVIRARERGAPQGRKPIDWKSITDLPVSSRSEAIEKSHWYAQRWKIETFHKILKSDVKQKMRNSGQPIGLQTWCPSFVS